MYSARLGPASQPTAVLMALDPPDIRLELIEDLSPKDPRGFLSLVRRRFRAHYPDGSVSEPFEYDEIDRAALDAVVIAAHYRDRDGPRIWLRSAVRPPVVMRDPARSPLPEKSQRGLWELPAGLIEKDEQDPDGPRRAARRELFEELGFDVDQQQIQMLGPSTYPAPGIVAERHFHFHVPVDPALRIEPPHDGSPLEHLGAVVALPLGEALEMCRRGEIEDAKSELGLRRLVEELSKS
jgi:ADP-ribose pyrophosphatase